MIDAIANEKAEQCKEAQMLGLGQGGCAGCNFFNRIIKVGLTEKLTCVH